MLSQSIKIKWLPPSWAPAVVLLGPQQSQDRVPIFLSAPDWAFEHLELWSKWVSSQLWTRESSLYKVVLHLILCKAFLPWILCGRIKGEALSIVYWAHKRCPCSLILCIKKYCNHTKYESILSRNREIRTFVFIHSCWSKQERIIL